MPAKDRATASLARHAKPRPDGTPARLRTFRDFCETALYHPRRGFYSRRRPTEHFYTAPELHPAFGWTLAKAVRRWLADLRSLGVASPYAVVEMGSGAGLLSRQLQEGLSRQAPDLAQDLLWVLVERSRERLREGVLSLSAGAGRVLGCARLADVPPLRGVLLSNELVDALPFHVLEKRAGSVRELYADDSGASALGGLSDPALAAHARAVADTLAEGQRHGVCLESGRWLAEAAGRLESGYIVTIDYGKRFRSGDVNPPRSYCRHATDDRITADPGRRDLTVPVDFSALIAEGGRLGLSCASFTSLARFLLDHGLLDFMPAGCDAAALGERAKLKTLVHPEGMGEAFKVLVQTKGLGPGERPC